MTTSSRHRLSLAFLRSNPVASLNSNHKRNDDAYDEEHGNRDDTGPDRLGIDIIMPHYPNPYAAKQGAQRGNNREPQTGCHRLPSSLKWTPEPSKLIGKRTFATFESVNRQRKHGSERANRDQRNRNDVRDLHTLN
jgi:hypothetical protein